MGSPSLERKGHKTFSYKQDGPAMGEQRKPIRANISAFFMYKRTVRSTTTTPNTHTCKTRISSSFGYLMQNYRYFVLLVCLGCKQCCHLNLPKCAHLCFNQGLNNNPNQTSLLQTRMHGHGSQQKHHANGSNVT